MSQTADIVIVGGGLVGLTLASLCARENLTVVVVEQRKPIDWQVERIDLRCVAISKHSQQLFETIGIWDQIKRVSPYTQMRVWDAQGYGEILFQAQEVGETTLGHIIENGLLLDALWKRVESDPLIRIVVEDKPVSIHVEPGEAILELSSGQSFRCCLLVGAEGKHSWVRSTSGIALERRPYEQTAVVATVQTERAHENTAWQRFLKTGPIAFLPLIDSHQCSIVWSTTPAEADRLVALASSDFQSECSKALDYRLGKVLNSSTAQQFALEQCHASHYVKPRVALVGDAAHVVHPLAGQGVNFGLKGVLTLVETLAQARRKQGDIGELLALRPYERAHKSFMSSAMFGLEFIRQCFHSPSSVMSELRSLGVNAIDRIPFVKRQLIQQAMGI